MYNLKTFTKNNPPLGSINALYLSLYLDNISVIELIFQSDDLPHDPQVAKLAGSHDDFGDEDNNIDDFEDAYV